LSYEYLRLEFSQRSPSDHQKLPELSLRAARRAFRDIAGYRNRCALHLRHETEQFFTGSVFVKEYVRETNFMLSCHTTRS